MDTPQPHVAVHYGVIGCPLLPNAVEHARHDDELHTVQSLASSLAIGRDGKPRRIVRDRSHLKVVERVQRVLAGKPAAEHPASRRGDHAQGLAKPAVHVSSGRRGRSPIAQPAPHPGRAFGAQGVEDTG